MRHTQRALLRTREHLGEVLDFDRARVHLNSLKAALLLSTLGILGSLVYLPFGKWLVLRVTCFPVFTESSGLSESSGADSVESATLSFWLLRFQVLGCCAGCAELDAMCVNDGEYADCADTASHCADAQLGGILATFLWSFAALMTIACFALIVALPFYLDNIKAIRKILAFGWFLVSIFTIGAFSSWSDLAVKPLKDAMGECGEVEEVVGEQDAYTMLVVVIFVSLIPLTTFIFCYYDDSTELHARHKDQTVAWR